LEKLRRPTNTDVILRKIVQPHHHGRHPWKNCAGPPTRTSSFEKLCSPTTTGVILGKIAQAHHHGRHPSKNCATIFAEDPEPNRMQHSCIHLWGESYHKIMTQKKSLFTKRLF
jgi:hypothetical protein